MLRDHINFKVIKAEPKDLMKYNFKLITANQNQIVFLKKRKKSRKQIIPETEPNALFL